LAATVSGLAFTPAVILFIALPDKKQDRPGITEIPLALLPRLCPERPSIRNSMRRDGEHIYLEKVLPEAAKQAGCFSLADLQKKGDTHSGTAKESCVCQYQKRRGLSVFYDTIINRYANEWPMEITKFNSNSH
jgi:hypothetical protein